MTEISFNCQDVRRHKKHISVLFKKEDYLEQKTIPSYAKKHYDPVTEF